ELVLDTEHATYAIFSLTGSAGRGAIAQPPDDGSRLPAPGAYAVLMPGVGALDAPDGVGTIQLDGDGRWLDTIVGWLLEMGSSWHWHPSVRSRSSSGQNAR
ncbi:MAG TPA: hypothetical protein VM451_06585, partial [Candidatus Limnocylindria bacterium]|nr:hypothetical protein [Candidatus Limnocylindria bacterium]